jgi:DNA-binding protein HU-beta
MGVTLKKNDLIADIATRSGLSKADSGRVLDSITATLSSGGEVRIIGFGTFSVSNRAATTGRNPRTGAVINIPASKQPKFKAGSPLKDAVNN